MIGPSSIYVQLSKCEEKAYKRYPRFTTDIGHQVTDYYPGERNAFISGYREAENDTIEKAVKWIEENILGWIDSDVIYPDAPTNLYLLEGWAERFKEDMKDE